MGGPLAQKDLSPSVSSPYLSLFDLSRYSWIVSFSEKRNSPGKADPFVPSISGLLPVKQNGRGYFKRLSSLLDSASASCWLNPDPLDWSSFQHLSKGGIYCRETLMLIEVT